VAALLTASLVWALSFGLIKTRLADLDPRAVALVRLALAAAVFAPWLPRLRGAARRRRYAALGAVQFGAMYVLYIASYAHLPAYAVALFTVFTPLYVVLIGDAWSRRLAPRHLVAAALAVAGGALVAWRGLPPGDTWRGILLLQGANLCFAAGQLVYRRWRLAPGGATLSEAGNLAWMYLGATLLAGVAAVAAGDVGTLREADAGARWTLLYLGLLPTGVAFYLWNRGAGRVGAGVLAAANNLKIPLAVLLAWTVFGETARLLPALGGLVAVTSALFVAGDAAPHGDSIRGGR
jgi:drug/metabolite transporter (DMT)-like permease